MSNFNMAANEGEKLTRQFIQSRMDDKGITRYQLQQLTGINRSTIGRWLDGETSISVNNYLKILGALEIRPYLIPAEEDATEMMRCSSIDTPGILICVGVLKPLDFDGVTSLLTTERP